MGAGNAAFCGFKESNVGVEVAEEWGESWKRKKSLLWEEQGDGVEGKEEEK